MSAFDILQRWLQPLLDPPNEVRGVIQQPLSIHQEAVSTFASLVAGLYDGPEGFQGEAADAVKATTESYLHVEAQFSGAGSAATGTFAAAAVLTIPTATTETVLESAADTSVECAVEITAAATSAATEIGADAGLDAVTEVVDVAAVAQAGLDPVTDIPAGVLTAIDLGTKIVILVALGWSIFQAVQRWIGDMNRLGHITWPPLPSFMDPLTPGGRSSYPDLPVNKATLEDWKREFPAVPEEYSKELMEQGFDGNQIRARLRRYQQMKALQDKFPLVPMEFIYQLLAKGQLNEKEMEVALSHYTTAPLSPVPMTPAEQALYNKLLADFIKEFTNIDPSFLQHLVTAKFIKDSLKEDQITAFLKAHKNDMEYIAWLYTQMATIPGAEHVLRDLAGGSKESYKGSLYQMEYVLYIKPEVTELEPTEKGQHGVDIVLKDGTIIVDVKSYNWIGTSASYNTSQGKKFAEQIQRFRKIYGPDVKIRYTFDRKGTLDGKVPDQVQRELKKADPNIDIQGWP